MSDPRVDFVDQMLAAHNRLRAAHHAPPLELDADLNHAAQAWAEKLAAKNFLTYAENAGIGENITFFPESMSAADVVDYWYKENAKYEYETPGWQAGTNYFTQIVWKSTKQIGIGYASISDDQHQRVIVAFYKPAGNCNRDGEFANNVLKPTTTITNAKN